jgi:DNA-binding HxlR family transcriptional regulator
MNAVWSRPVGRKRFGDMNCGIAQALEVLGDWWTLLIVRDAFFGVRHLGIAKNILSDRLSHLVEHGIFEKQAVGESGQRFEYRLTEKGEALLPLLTALREWSDEWVFGRGHEPVIVKDRKSGRRVPKLRVTDAEGRPLGRRDLRTEPGPGASAETIRLLKRPRADR